MALAPLLALHYHMRSACRWTRWVELRILYEERIYSDDWRYSYGDGAHAPVRRDGR